MALYQIQITHTLLIQAYNRPTAELIAKQATPEPTKVEGVLQIKPVSKMISQEVI